MPLNEKLTFEVISQDPQILLIPNFITEEEAAYLITKGAGLMQRSTVVCDDPAGCIDERRTSSSAHIGEDPYVEPIRDRARYFSRLRTCETIQVVHYYPGQEFRPHLDAFSASTKEGKKEIAIKGQRGATFLIYLNKPEGGGATVFPEAGLSVLPVPLAAVFWRHQRPDGSVDPKMLHGGAPVEAGEKWGVNVWLRLPVRRPGVQINAQLQPSAA